MLNVEELKQTIAGLTLPLDNAKISVMYQICTETVPQLLDELQQMHLTFALLHGGGESVNYELTTYSPQDAETAQPTLENDCGYYQIYNVNSPGQDQARTVTDYDDTTQAATVINHEHNQHSG